MQRSIQELPGTAGTGGLVAVIGALTLWRLGIEFERAWRRSEDGPLLGDDSTENHAMELVSMGTDDDRTTKDPGTPDGRVEWVPSLVA
jgi:hypothetical protein